MENNAAKSFDILITNWSVLYNYFDDSTKLFLNLYLIKFLDSSVNSFFLCGSGGNNFDNICSWKVFLGIQFCVYYTFILFFFNSVQGLFRHIHRIALSS